MAAELEHDPLPTWARTEVAWPLAILAGFAGTWVGLISGVGWMAAAWTLGLYAPLQRALARRESPALGAATAVGWAVGIAGAVLGGTVEGELDPARLALPTSALFARDLAACGPAGVAPGLPWLGLALIAAPLALGALGARLSRGLLPLGLAAVGTGAVAAAAAPAAAQAVARGVSPLIAVLASWPPQHAAWIVALLLAAAIGASERPAAVERPARLAALALGVAALPVRLALAPLWARWAAGVLGAS